MPFLSFDMVCVGSPVTIILFVTVSVKTPLVHTSMSLEKNKIVKKNGEITCITKKILLKF